MIPLPNLLAVMLATVLAFVAAGAYYAAFGGRLASLSPAYADPQRSPVATVAVELPRTFVVVLVAAGLAVLLGATGVGEALLLALVLWVAFPVVLLTGSVFHERVPAPLAAIHAGDWLLKLAIGTVVGTLWS